MQAVTLWQPYASLIAAGAKRFETRSWAAPRRLIGERIAIHAALRRPTPEEVRQLSNSVELALGLAGWHTLIPYGCVVCTAQINACYGVKHWNNGRPVLSGLGEIEDDGFGDYTPGRYCWELTGIDVCKPPVPAKGAQGFWTWKSCPGPLLQD